MSSPSAYRVITQAAWRLAEREGHVSPSPLDQRDGFIHLSTSETMLETARLYFAVDDAPLILELSTEALGPALRWEAVAARGGQRFPHLYAPRLPLSALVALIELKVEGGQLSLGERVAYSAE